MKSRFLGLGLLLALASYGIASGDEVFDYGFSAAEGFTDGALNGQFGHASQGVWGVDSTGSGNVNAASPSFGRFSAQDASDVIDWTALAVGDVITLSANGLSTTSAGGQLGVLGLTTLLASDGDNVGGNGNSQLGGQLTSDGTNYFLDEGAFAVSGGATDTGIALGTLVNYQVQITKQSETTADVYQSLTDGTTFIDRTDFGVADAGNNNASGSANLDSGVAVIFQTQNGNVGATSIDGWSADVTAVPEPASSGLIMVCLGALGLVRRRNS